MNLKEKLLFENKKRWLDIGSGGIFEEGFFYLDLFPEGVVDREFRDRYFRVDILNASNSELEKLGKFDFIRMQHVFEHFTPEDGLIVLKNCAKLLNPEGIILITVPDLKIHIEKYLKNEYKNWAGFKWWANKRIPDDAPNSFYFSIFAHSMPFESHKWCYDFDGLQFQIKNTGEFKNIQELKTTDELANNPFTHNRPEEDACVMAVKI